MSVDEDALDFLGMHLTAQHTRCSISTNRGQPLVSPIALDNYRINPDTALQVTLIEMVNDQLDVIDLCVMIDDPNLLT